MSTAAAASSSAAAAASSSAAAAAAAASGAQDGAAAPTGPVSLAAFKANAAQLPKEYTRFCAFDAAGRVIHSTFPVDSAEIAVLLTACDNRDVTVGRGLQVAGLDFEVHRFYDDIVYGRRGEAGEGDGVCLVRAMNTATQKYIYVVITFALPMLSSRAIPILQTFVKHNVVRWTRRREQVVDVSERLS